MRSLTLALLPIAVAACDSPPAPPPVASAAAPAAPPASPAPAAAAPPDLDVAALQKTLKCGGESKSGACGVLAKMTRCQTWSAAVPSGDGRWLGRGWVIEGSKTEEQLTLLRARRAPQSDVGPGQLGVKIAVTDLPKQEGAAHDQADRAIRALERSDVPPRGSEAIEYAKQRTAWPEAFAMRTAGGQVYALTQNGTYVCQGAKQTLLLVQRGSGGAASGDGLYAEVWPTSW